MKPTLLLPILLISVVVAFPHDKDDQRPQTVVVTPGVNKGFRGQQQPQVVVVKQGPGSVGGRPPATVVVQNQKPLKQQQKPTVVVVQNPGSKKQFQQQQPTVVVVQNADRPRHWVYDKVLERVYMENKVKSWSNHETQNNFLNFG